MRNAARRDEELLPLASHVDLVQFLRHAGHTTANFAPKLAAERPRNEVCAYDSNDLNSIVNLKSKSTEAEQQKDRNTNPSAAVKEEKDIANQRAMITVSLVYLR